MVTLHSIVASGAETAFAIADLDGPVRARSVVANFVRAFHGCDHGDDAPCVFLLHLFPCAAILGGTFRKGVMTAIHLWSAGSIRLPLVADVPFRCQVTAGEQDGLVGRTCKAIR